MSSLTFGVLMGLPGLVWAQVAPSTGIPSTAPTQSVSDLPSARPAGSSAARGVSRVTWDGALLSVDAGGDSLRNILRAVVRETGMKVTGGVPEEQVFGAYGPGTVQVVLSSLFSGMNVNMMLVNSSVAKPKELVLTARMGGPTPPSPGQSLEVQDQPGAAAPPPAAFSRTPAGNAGTVDLPGVVLPPADSTPNGGAAVDANGQPQSPNGVRTPEQIFEELRRRQQGTVTR